MEALLREKAKEIYSEKIVDYGTNPKNYGTMDNPDGYAKESDDCGKGAEMFIRMKDGKVEESKFISCLLGNGGDIYGSTEYSG